MTPETGTQRKETDPGAAAAVATAASNAVELETESLADAANKMGPIRFDADGVAIPPELKALSRTTRSFYEALPKEKQEEAKRRATEFDFNDRMKIALSGETKQQDAETAATKLMNTTKTFEIGEAGESLIELRRQQERLGVGGVQSKWWQRAAGKVGLGSLADPFRKYLDEQTMVGEHMDQIFDAWAKEKLRLIDLRETVKLMREECQSVESQLAVDVSAAELVLTRAEKDFKELARKYRGTDDSAQIREIKHAFMGLVALDDHITMLKSSRAINSRAIDVTDIQEDVVIGLVQKFGAYKQVKQLWSTIVAETIVNYKVSGALKTIEESRDAFNKIMSANTDQLEQVVRRYSETLGRGIVDPAVFRALAERTKRAQEAMVVGMKEARTKLQAEGKEFDKIFEEMKADKKKYAESMSILDSEQPKN